MSACISRAGEFSEHTVENEFMCSRCGVLDEDAMRAELARLREHSIFANHISWRIAEAVGDVPTGADRVIADPDEQLTRLIARAQQGGAR